MLSEAEAQCLRHILYELRAYLLRPHRGACPEAWLRLKHCEVERVGRTLWPATEAEFARRCEDLQPCPYRLKRPPQKEQKANVQARSA
jgi:hypothetical protein